MLEDRVVDGVEGVRVVQERQLHGVARGRRGLDGVVGHRLADEEMHEAEVGALNQLSEDVLRERGHLEGGSEQADLKRCLSHDALHSEQNRLGEKCHADMPWEGSCCQNAASGLHEHLTVSGLLAKIGSKLRARTLGGFWIYVAEKRSSSLRVASFCSLR